jgi:hypothetical protein
VLFAALLIFFQPSTLQAKPHDLLNKELEFVILHLSLIFFFVAPALTDLVISINFESIIAYLS